MKTQQFLRLALVAATFTLVSCEKEWNESSASYSQNQNLRTAPARNPLFIPPALAANGVTLTAAPGTTTLGSGSVTTSWEYNGTLPGPTLTADAGTNVSVLFRNDLPEPCITHWHGLVVSHNNDGHPADAVAPGGTYSYNFPIIQRAGLYWYHPHTEMLTGKQVFLGLAGGFVVRDAEEYALNLPGGGYEVPLVLRDATLDKSGNIKYQPSAGGMFGKIPLVNGTINPYLDVDRAVYRFRILNGSNSRVMNISLTNNVPFILIGNDGGLLPSSSNQTTLLMSNGERVDVLIDFRAMASGTRIMLKDLNASWDLLEFRVGSNQVSYGGSLSTTSAIQPLGAPVTTRTFTFDAMSKINGKEYDMNRIDWTVPLGQTEKWVFIANGNGPHPVHIHGASFQVLSRTGGRGQLFPWEAGWKDTVLLEDGETVSVLVRFDAYRGIYLMHCHKLEHEDMGMMANFEVL